ncbi:MAG TPA: low molecular weight protein-tyrosine-phosphatase [Longimicrobium sp.]|jgi:protein-tyrosine phosphatase
MTEPQLELKADGTWQPIRVLFVCLGNICRSPLAEAVFRHQVAERGWTDRFDIDSAGTSGWHRGAPPDARSTETARRRGIELAGRSRRVSAADLRNFDYVIAMDAENRAALDELAAQSGGTAEVRRLREFEPGADSPDVPDPYYGGPDGFEDVHDIVERACAGLLAHIAAGRGLR